MNGIRRLTEELNFCGLIMVLALTACSPSKVTISPDMEIASPTSTATSISTPGPKPNVLAALPTSNLSPSLLPATPSKTPTSLPPTMTPMLMPSLTPSPTATPTRILPTVTPTPTASAPTPRAEAQIEATPDNAYRYVPIGTAQPDLSQPCPGCPRAPGYITGRVIDATDQPLAGVRLACYNDWHRYPVVGSKGGGEYDFPILQAEATWYVVVLDESDQPLSQPAAVDFNPLEACWYRLDWQQVD